MEMKDELEMRSSVTLKELINSGELEAPIGLAGVYDRFEITGRLLRDGSIQVGREKFDSPSVAAGIAITRATGRVTPGRRYISINGWKFWRVRPARRGASTSLEELRRTSQAAH